MAVEILINQAGPLEMEATFNSPSDGPMMVYVSGSVWSSTANVMIGIGVAIDGTNVANATIFSNGGATHRAVVPIYIPVKLTSGQHTISLSAANTDTVSDYNDFYQAALIF